MMWEALELRAPWGGEEYKFAHRIVHAVASGKRPTISPQALAANAPQPKEYIPLMQRAWAQLPDDRPGFPEIFDAMKRMSIMSSDPSSIPTPVRANPRRGSSYGGSPSHRLSHVSKRFVDNALAR